MISAATTSLAAGLQTLSSSLRRIADERHFVYAASREAVEGVGRRTRARRMRQFAELLGLRPGTRILDLGGRPEIWESIAGPFEITILNLPGETGADVPSRHNVTFVEGDATCVEFPDDSFDLVFSNSVIEHVGPEEKQRAFAREVRRLAPAYWVQTPFKWFPVEAHTGMPLWWLYPSSVRAAFIVRWGRDFPEWAESMRETRVLRRNDLQGLFPGAQLWVESVLGLPKSCAVYARRNGAAAIAV